METQVHDDLEIATRMIFEGDITPMFWRLIKDSPFITDLLAVLGEEIVSVNPDESSTTLRPEDNNRPSFEKWFSKCQEL